MPSEKQWIGHLFDRLKAQLKVAFPRKGEAVSASKHPGGMYIIRRGRKVVHVGRTVRGSQGLCQRLRNHLHGNSSFTVNYLGGHGKRLRQGHTYQCLVVEKGRNRALLESYATGRLCPDYIGLGETVLKKSVQGMQRSHVLDRESLHQAEHLFQTLLRRAFNCQRFSDESRTRTPIS